MLCRKTFDETTFFLLELPLKLPDPVVLHVSGIDQLLDPLALLLVLVMQLTMKCLVLLQNVASVNAGSESAYIWGLAELLRLNSLKLSGSKYQAGENLSQA